MDYADSARKGRRARQVWLGYWAAIFILTHLPVGEIHALRKGGDKVIHYMLFGGLALLGGHRLWSERGRATTAALMGWAGIYAVYGAVDEWSQGFVGRTSSLFDWLFNMTGILTATILMLLLRRCPMAGLRGTPDEQHPRSGPHRQSGRTGL